MTTFVSGAVTVSVPATAANLGPGFDSLGLALQLRDRLTGQVTSSGLDVEVVGEGAADVTRDETHLVVRAMHRAFDRMGERPAGLRLRCANVIPHARGLGSSSAAIVGGIALARTLVADGPTILDDESAFRLAAELEGHPDNVAPAWYGGLVVSGREEDSWWAVKLALHPGVATVVYVPPTPVATRRARGLLPATVPHAEAAANAGRAALLVAALAGRPEHLHLATRDWLHQAYRSPVMPASIDLVAALRSRGVAAVVSGAGPSVLVLCDEAEVGDLVEGAPAGWRAYDCQPDPVGVRTE